MFMVHQEAATDRTAMTAQTLLQHFAVQTAAVIAYKFGNNCSRKKCVFRRMDLQDSIE